MGICLKNKEYSMDMGYGSFYNLRKKIAHLYNEEFGNIYEQWVNGECDNSTINLKMEELFQNNTFIDQDSYTLNFLFQSDCEGKISYKDCKRLLEIIGDYTDNIQYGYVYANNSFSYFKEMLRNCYNKRRNLYWY